MAVLNKLHSPLFLEENEIRKVIELLFLFYSDFMNGPNKILEKINFSRTHLKIIYFAGKQKGITIKELLKILHITKQSLSRLVNQLVELKYVNIEIGIDKRTKNLTLTKKGVDLENELTKILIKKIKNILENANENEVKGFKKILIEMIDSDRMNIFNDLKKLNI